MIDVESAARGVFHLCGKHTSYLFRVTRYGHLEHVHWGQRVQTADADALAVKTSPNGYQVAYADDDPAYSLDIMPLEWSGLGRGDYRVPAAEVRLPGGGGFVTDFRYKSYEIIDGTVAPLDGLPSARGEIADATTLKVVMADGDVELDLYYTVFEDCDVITRRSVLRNGASEPIVVRKLMSQQVDLPNRGYDLITFDGTWAAEANRHTRQLAPGTYVNESLTGYSSNRHNAGVILATRGASEHFGECYGFNLVYSGNHRTAVELSHRDLVRVESGINPTGFEWTLGSGERFETPEAVLVYSSDGFDTLSGTMHTFVQGHVVPPQWASADRPVLVNTWESAMFNVNQKTVLRQARLGKQLGAEMVVLDDGWFTGRKDDHAGLGDYGVDKHKFPRGLAWLSGRVHAMGLKFGLWVEPEMVNQDSALYRAHPEWAVSLPGREPCLQRHQMILDLSQAPVRDYVVEQVSALIDDYHVDYIKWDCNRNFTDASGELMHRNVLGFYDVLRRIFFGRPQVLLESCASGGNRFDLGVLCFSPQIWASDCTDPVERLGIQGGLSYLYPPSTMGAHVTASPSAQTLRATPLSTRFNVAAFGVLGYEFDLTTLTRVQRRDVKAQIDFYKRNRRVLQHGRFRRLEIAPADQVAWASSIESRTVVGHYQTRTHSLTPPPVIGVPGLDAARRYRVESRAQGVSLNEFGHLLAFVLPRWLRPEGQLVRTLAQYYQLTDLHEQYKATGAALAAGFVPAVQFEGSDDQSATRLWGDHGSTLYEVTPTR